MVMDKDSNTASSEAASVAITVFFPCYNEQDNVERTCGQAVDVLERICADYEVIIVDDGSKDETGLIADRLASQNNRIKVIHHCNNRGYGAALTSGFRVASKPLVFYTDGDGQFDINEMPQLLPLIEKYDIVSCFRLDRKDPLVRKINGWCWTKLVNIMFGMRIKDIDCAFKLYRTEIFKDMKLSSRGALIDTEVLARAIRKGCTVTQVGVHHYPRTAGSQTGANLKVVIRAFKELFKLYREICNEPRPKNG